MQPMFWNWLRRWWRGRTEPHRVVMYTRRGCHLCDDAWALLEQAARSYSLTLSKLDVDTDAALAARHGLEVPVVEIDGKVRFRGRVNRVLLARLLRAEATASGGC